MIKIFILATLLINSYSLQSNQFIGQSFSIIALTLSVPHSFFFKQHIRLLHFMQTSYLITSISELGYENNLKYSIMSFMPTFLPNNPGFFQQSGGVLSFMIIVVGFSLLSFTFYKIEKIWYGNLKYKQIWAIMQCLIDWGYLILIDQVLKHLTIKLKQSLSDGEIGPIVELIIIIMLLIVCALYPLLLFYIKNKQKIVEENKKQVAELVLFIKIILIALIINLALKINFKIIYLLYVIFVVYVGLNLKLNEFVNKGQKIIFVSHQIGILLEFSFILFGNMESINYGFYIIIPVFVLEFVFQLYKYYKFVLFKKKKRIMIYPQKIFDEPKQKFSEELTINKRHSSNTKELESTQSYINDAIINSNSKNITKRPQTPNIFNLNSNNS